MDSRETNRRLGDALTENRDKARRKLEHGARTFGHADTWEQAKSIAWGTIANAYDLLERESVEQARRKNGALKVPADPDGVRNTFANWITVESIGMRYQGPWWFAFDKAYTLAMSTLGWKDWRKETDPDDTPAIIETDLADRIDELYRSAEKARVGILADQRLDWALFNRTYHMLAAAAGKRPAPDNLLGWVETEGELIGLFEDWLLVRSLDFMPGSPSWIACREAYGLAAHALDEPLVFL